MQDSNRWLMKGVAVVNEKSCTNQQLQVIGRTQSQNSKAKLLANANTMAGVSKSSSKQHPRKKETEGNSRAKLVPMKNVRAQINKPNEERQPSKMLTLEDDNSRTKKKSNKRVTMEDDEPMMGE